MLVSVPFLDLSCKNSDGTYLLNNINNNTTTINSNNTTSVAPKYLETKLRGTSLHKGWSMDVRVNEHSGCQQMA